MKNHLKPKLFRVSSLLITLGVVLGLLENTFYQYLDAEGVLHESGFMPFSFISILVGTVGFFCIGIGVFRQLFKKT